MQRIRLSELIGEIDRMLHNRFNGQTFWVTAEITDVKKQPDKRWCFLKFIEKDGSAITTEIKGVFWATTYNAIEKFEKMTGKTFASGMEITCNVKVRFHKRFGLDLEVLDIDVSHTLGKLELERQETLDRLVHENPTTIKMIDGNYHTRNKQLPLPMVLQRVALVTAPNSDGQQDFLKEIEHNQYGYAYVVTQFLTTIQGDSAAASIITQLKVIEKSQSEYDVIAIVRGGGSQTDFKPFEDYELAKYVAGFPLPIITGIGHDRNTSIVDLMARQQKTPTKAACHIIDQNFAFESNIVNLKERFFYAAETMLTDAQNHLTQTHRILKSYSPASTIARGYAIIMQGDKIITNPKDIEENTEIQTILRNETIISTVTKKTINEKGFDL